MDIRYISTCLYDLQEYFLCKHSGVSYQLSATPAEALGFPVSTDAQHALSGMKDRPEPKKGES